MIKFSDKLIKSYGAKNKIEKTKGAQDFFNLVTE